MRRLGLAIALVAWGCATPNSASPDPSEILQAFAIPVHATDGAAPDAALAGRLEEATGCLSLVDPRVGPYVVIWPARFTARRNAGDVEVTDPNGVVYRPGEILVLGGRPFDQERDGSILSMAHNLPPACNRSPFWLAWSVDRRGGG